MRKHPQPLSQGSMATAASKSKRASTANVKQTRQYARISPRLVLLLPAITLLGLTLRLYKLNQESVGFDEAFSIAACRLPLAAMLKGLIEDFVHPPLHYFVLRGWLDIFGSSVVPARMLSVVFGVLAIPLLYVISEYLFDRRTALFSSLLLAVSQLEIMFAQEARPYAQFLFLFLASWYLFIRALHSRSAKLWCAFIASSILLIYTHYFGVLVLGALAIYGFLYRKQHRIPAVWWIGGAAATLLAYLPWLTSGIFQAAAHSAKTFSGKHAFWSVGGSTFFTAVNFFNNGKPVGLLGSSPLWTFVIGGLLFTAPVALALWDAKAKRESPNAMLALMLWVLPMLGAIAAGLLHFQYNVRYVAFCAAPYYLLVGRGISTIRPILARMAWILALLVYTGNALRANFFMPRKEDFRAAGAYISRNYLPGDCGVFFPGFELPLQWSIEHPGQTVFRHLRTHDLSSDVRECGRIWAISSSVSGNPWQWAKAAENQQALEATHTKINEKRYFWVHVALYSRKRL